MSHATVSYTHLDVYKRQRMPRRLAPPIPPKNDNGTEMTSAPVSYTHLDVYKRQAMPWALAIILGIALTMYVVSTPCISL